MGSHLKGDSRALPLGEEPPHPGVRSSGYSRAVHDSVKRGAMKNCTNLGFFASSYDDNNDYDAHENDYDYDDY